MVECFVTGATGFVGSHVTRLLIEKGHSVSILAREESDHHLLKGLEYRTSHGNITDAESIRKAVPSDVEWLFHNAAIMAEWGTKSKYFPVNVEGTRNILEVVRRLDIPQFIHTSSTAVYGFPNTEEKIREDSAFNPENAYQESKLAAEELIHEYQDNYGIRASMVRAPAVVGHGDMYTTPQLIEYAKTDGMVLFSGGLNMQTIAHGEDFARCLILTAENFSKAAGNAYNVGSFTCQWKEFCEALTAEAGAEPKYRNYPYSVALGLGIIAERLFRAFNRKHPPILTAFRVKMFGTQYVLDLSKAKEHLGYEPKWNLQSTVQDMVQWGGFVKPR